MTAEIHEAPCPQCGQAVSVTLTTSEIGDQLAADRTTCPSCGASLVRAVEGHADQGWRVEDESGA
jgi:ribosomal protein S27AE